MEFEWDQAKSDRNLRERGFDFDQAVRIFEAPTFEVIDERFNYGEVRTIALGEIEGARLQSGFYNAQWCSTHYLFSQGQPAGDPTMAIIRRTLSEARTVARVDYAKVDATTEEDIRRHMIEDGFDPDDPFKALVPVIDPAALRRRLNLSQHDFALHLRIPVETIQAWENGQTMPDAPARTLLRLIDADPERPLRFWLRNASRERRVGSQFSACGLRIVCRR